MRDLTISENGTHRREHPFEIAFTTFIVRPSARELAPPGSRTPSLNPNVDTRPKPAPEASHHVTSPLTNVVSQLALGRNHSRTQRLRLVLRPKRRQLSAVSLSFYAETGLGGVAKAGVSSYDPLARPI